MAAAHTCMVDVGERADDQPPLVLTCTNCGSTSTHSDAFPDAENGREMPHRYATAIAVCSKCGSTAITSNR